jgi:hypothetical protein
MRILQLPIHIGFGHLLYCLSVLPHQSTVYDTKSQVHVYFCVLVIDRSRGENYCAMAVTLVRCTTATHEVYAELHAQRVRFVPEPTCATQWILVYSLTTVPLHSAHCVCPA